MMFSRLLPRRLLLLSAAVSGLISGGSYAASVQSGVLECSVAPGVGIIIGSSKSVSCVFHRPHGRPEFYNGTISRIGLDLGGTGPGQIVWGVVAAGSTGPYALAGTYSGPEAGFALGDGFNANALVGGSGNSISLQPMAAGASSGINLSAGIGALSLEPAVQPLRHVRHPG